MNQGVIKEFRNFLVQGNLIELAVAFIIAAAFSAVVGSLVNDVVMPLIAGVFGQPDFSSIGFDVRDAHVAVGALINALVNLILVGAAVFFFIVKPVQTIRARQRRGEEPAPAAAPPEDIALLREIRDLLSTRG